MPTTHTLVLALCIQLFTGSLTFGQRVKEQPNAPAVKGKSDGVKHLFVAKLLLRRMAEVDLTPDQLMAFNKLSADLRALIDKKRTAVGITKDTIKRRDKVYAGLKKTDLKGDALWNRLQAEAKPTAAQRDVFGETMDHYQKFKIEALNLLTKEQRARVPKAKRKR